MYSAQPFANLHFGERIGHLAACERLVNDVRESTHCDYAELLVFLPKTLTCCSFDRGGFSIKQLSENSLAQAWMMNSGNGNTYAVVDDVRCMKGQMPDEWRDQRKYTSFFSWGMQTASGSIWGTLTIAFQFPQKQFWREVVMTCCRLMDGFLQNNTRMAFLTDLCLHIVDMKRSVSFKDCAQQIHRFFMKHTARQLVSVSISLLNAKKDEALFFIDSGKEGVHQFKETKLEVTKKHSNPQTEE